MPNHLSELHQKRGRLIERIDHQRAQLVRDLQPVTAALHSADRAVSWGQSVLAYIRQRPHVAAAGVALVAILKARRVWRWTRRGLVALRAWRSLRNFSQYFPFLRPAAKP